MKLHLVFHKRLFTLSQVYSRCVPLSLKMIRITVTILIVQAFIGVMFLHWASSCAFVTFNNTYADERNGKIIQRYVQTVKESGTMMIGVREEKLRSHHRVRKVPQWTARFTFPYGKGADAPTRSYRLGVSVTTHDKPSGFKATYVYIRIWVIALLVFALGGLLWVEKWLFPLGKCFCQSIRKIRDKAASFTP